MDQHSRRPGGRRGWSGVLGTGVDQHSRRPGGVWGVGLECEVLT